MDEAGWELTGDSSSDCHDGCRHDCACLDHCVGLSIDDAGRVGVGFGKDPRFGCLNWIMMRESSTGSSMSAS